MPAVPAGAIAVCMSPGSVQTLKDLVSVLETQGPTFPCCSTIPHVQDDGEIKQTAATSSVPLAVKTPPERHGNPPPGPHDNAPGALQL